MDGVTSGRLGAVALALLIVPDARPQEPPRFPAETELVEIEVVVKDAKGEMVRDLRREDFVLLEQGRPQTISHFALRTTRRAVESPPAAGAAPAAPAAQAPVEVRPRHLVLAVDDLHLAAENLLKAKEALRRFVDEQLEPGDEAALVTTSAQLGFLEQFTTDPVVLRRAVERLGLRNRKAAEASAPPHLTVYQADLIERNDTDALNTAMAELLREDPLLPRTVAETQVRIKARELVLESSHSSRMALLGIESVIRRLQPLEGRKILVLLSDGFYLGATEHFDLRVITSAAARSGVVIYSLDTRGLVARSPAGDATRHGYDPTGAEERYWRLGFEADRDGLNALARDTGGLPVFNLNDLNQGLGRILEDTETYYLLAYEPTVSPRDGRFRKIEVRLPGRRGLEVRTRKGYFAPDDAAARKPSPSPREPAPAGATNSRLQEGLASLLPQTDLPVNLAGGWFDAPDGGPTALVSAEVDVSRVRFAQDGDRRRATLELAGLFLDERGRAAGSFGDRRELSLDEDAFARALRSGFSFSTRFPLKPGLYQVRVAVLAGSERLGTAARWLELPDLTRGRFAVSDLLLLPDGAESPRPVWDGRPFGRDQDIEFVLFAYNAKADPEVLTDVVFETQVLAGAELVLKENPQNIVVPVGDPPQERVAFSRRFALASFAPGEYTLRVLVTDRIAQAKAEGHFRFRVE